MIAFALGLFAGLAPGPYTTMVAGTAMERGFRASLFLALTPLVTDVPPMLFSAVLLERLGWRALNALGIVGGTVVLVVGIRFLRRNWANRDQGAEPGFPREGGSARLPHLLVSNLTNPSPWVFWLMAGSPLLLQSWDRGPEEGLAFLTVLFGTNITSALTLAWVASKSRTILGPGFQRRALQAVGSTLIVVGLLILWQAIQGDFQLLMDNQRAIHSVFDFGTPSG
jgi:threonine/homoserine/homoserine lactone efflux protein